MPLQLHFKIWSNLHSLSFQRKLHFIIITGAVFVFKMSANFLQLQILIKLSYIFGVNNVARFNPIISHENKFMILSIAHICISYASQKKICQNALSYKTTQYISLKLCHIFLCIKEIKEMKFHFNYAANEICLFQKRTFVTF